MIHFPYPVGYLHGTGNESIANCQPEVRIQPVDWMWRWSAGLLEKGLIEMGEWWLA